MTYRPNHKAASFIDVTLHQAARRDALALGIVPTEQPPKEMSLTAFAWAFFGILVSIIAVLVTVTP